MLRDRAARYVGKPSVFDAFISHEDEVRHPALPSPRARVRRGRTWRARAHALAAAGCSRGHDGVVVQVTHLPPGASVLASNAFTAIQAVSVNRGGGDFWAVQVCGCVGGWPTLPPWAGGRWGRRARARARTHGHMPLLSACCCYSTTRSMTCTSSRD